MKIERIGRYSWARQLCFVALLAVLPLLPITGETSEPTTIRNPTQAQGSEPIPAETVAVAISEGRTVSLRLEHEVLYDPSKSSLFNRPLAISVGRDNRLYVLDLGDVDVKVLAENGDHLLTFGGRGQGPGEFVNPWLIESSDAGDVYVYDRGIGAFHVFDADGQFQHALPLPQLHATAIEGFFLTSDSRMVVAGLSLQPELYQKPLHVFSITGINDRPRLQYVQSFAETQPYDPVIYLQAAGGKVFKDLDGDILYAEGNPCNLQEFTLAGELLWRFRDPDAMPPATDYFSVSSRGGVIIRAFARSTALFPLDEETFLHIMLLPPIERREHKRLFEEKSSPYFRRLFELVPRDDAENGRLRFEVDGMLDFMEVDSKGRLYGFWSDWDPAIIRSTVSRETSSPSSR